MLEASKIASAAVMNGRARRCALVLNLAACMIGCGSSSDPNSDPSSGAGSSSSGAAAGATSSAHAGQAGSVAGAAGVTGIAGSSSGGASGVAGAGSTAGGASNAGSPGSGGAGSSAGASNGNGGRAGQTPELPLGPVAYQQTFDALSAGLWKKNLDGSKIKAHPENAQVTASCGSDNSMCFRVVYRQADGIHKQPPSSPVFTSDGGTIGWTQSDASQTNTATDVTQGNINIDGSITGKDSATASAVPSKAYTLSYDVYFEPGFDFAKGGKLPGLAAAAFDSGCSEDGSDKRQISNWSERVMWRANGRLQLYSYDQSRPSGSCGVEKTIDLADGDPQFEQPGVIPNDDKFRLKGGVWYTIRISVRVNDNDSVKYLVDGSNNPIKDVNGYLQPISGNGAVSLAIKAADGSGARLISIDNLAVRDECNGPCPKTVPDSKDAWVNAVFFSTFFGGNETKRLTCVDSAASTLTTVVPAKPPSFPGLTQSVFDQLCASQINVAIFPKLTWEPQTPSAARFDNFIVKEGYTSAPL